ncbi:HNH endonuclease signature motif containing protein [Streptomyces sp. NPDC090442]|uniref:HNH endonuclease signature motif containing protein n=1 Tax=Streptomyces sp. NPDC090442 TaxID=3365962 RepID=UPI00381D1879
MRRFVVVTARCWVFVGGLGGDGYGRFWAHDPEGGGATIVRPTRWIWQAHHGPIPAGMVVRHKCDRSICARPDCLTLGLPVDNSQDMSRRDRTVRLGWRVSKADRRGQLAAARALRTAILRAVAAGVYSPQALASVVTHVDTAGDPHAGYDTLF